MAHMVGRYELVRPLGRGGMAEVFLARRRGPGGVEKRLVLKRIRRERATDPRFMKLFVQEARLSMSLAHRNIVPMFDFGRAGDELFLVMEFVDGRDLAGALERGKAIDRPIDPVVAAFVAMEMCQALDYAHRAEHAVIHRDVTPRNVLLSREGEVKLVDFGVATTETDVGGARKVRGTPAYMSPEQARGDDVDPRSDLFSVGLVLWEALAGHRAYPHKNVSGLLDAAIAGDVPALPDDMSARLRTIVERATARAPDDRYSSAREMQVALDEYLVHERTAGTGRPPPTHELAAWLGDLFENAPNANAAGVAEAPEGPVVTFLEDGLEEIERTLAGGNTTMRSMAETVVEETSAEPEPEPTELAAAPATEHTHRGGLAIAALIGIVAIAGVGIAVAVKSVGSSDTAVAADATAAAAATDAAPLPPLPDASAPPPPPDAAPPDAKPRTAIRRPPPPPSATGTVEVGSNPWARVTVKGRSESCPETPCALTLPAGEHTLVLVNDQANRRATRTVTINANETTKISVTLTRP